MRRAHIPLLCAVVFACACSKPAELSQPARLASSPESSNHQKGEIDGAAFLKLVRGIDPIAGAEMELYGQDFIAFVEEAHSRSEKAERDIATLTARRKTLEQAKRSLAMATTWGDWKTKIATQQADFEDKGYSSLMVFDPIFNRTTEISWHNDRDKALGLFTRIIVDCEDRRRAALGHADALMKPLGMTGSVDDEMIRTDQRMTEVKQQRQLETIILDQARGKFVAVKKSAADGDGKFKFRNLPAGRYAVCAHYTEPLSARSYVWYLPVEVGSAAEDVVLSQANAFGTEEGVAPEKKPELYLAIP